MNETRTQTATATATATATNVRFGFSPRDRFNSLRFVLFRLPFGLWALLSGLLWPSSGLKLRWQAKNASEKLSKMHKPKKNIHKSRFISLYVVVVVVTNRVWWSLASMSRKMLQTPFCGANLPIGSVFSYWFIR